LTFVEGAGWSPISPPWINMALQVRASAELGAKSETA
jgi:hypothetical protein